MIVLPVVEIILDYVKHASHLREDKNPVALQLQLGQQFVKHSQLAAVSDDVIAHFVFTCGLSQELGLLVTYRQTRAPGHQTSKGDCNTF